VTFERKVPRVPGCDGVIFCYGTIDEVLNIREADISVWNVSNGVLAPQSGGAYAELSPIDGPFHAVGFDVSAPNAFVSVSLGPRGGMATQLLSPSFVGLISDVPMDFLALGMSRDPSSGNPVTFDNMSFRTTAVPEPATSVLILGALAIVLQCRRVIASRQG
jgi:hypothetical protein